MVVLVRMRWLELATTTRTLLVVRSIGLLLRHADTKLIRVALALVTNIELLIVLTLILIL